MKNCIVTIANSKYLLGVVLLHYSLKQNNTQTDFIVLYDNLSEMELTFLNNYGISCTKKKIISNTYENNRFSNVFMKLHCWSMMEYNKIIYVDSDILNLRNFEDLFDIDVKTNEIIASTASIGNKTPIINSGFFLIKPCLEVYDDLISKLQSKIYSYDKADQGFLNTYFKGNIVYINDNYNISKRRKSYNISDIINLHFVGLPKPWNKQGERGYEMYNKLWIETYNKCVHEYWSKTFGNYLIELNNIVYNSKYRVEGNLLYNHNLLRPSDRIWYESETKRHKLFEVVKNKHTVLEIGVNGGHSALLMFTSNPKLHYYGFDINHHSYTKDAIKFLKDKFTNVNYIIGDSEKTIPIFNDKNVFDVIHIDGGHTIEKARADILNCKRLSNANTIIVFDDCNTVGGMGPKLLNLWNNLIQEKIIEEISELNMYQQDWDNKIGKYIH